MTAFELFNETGRHLLEDEKPSIFLSDAQRDGLFKKYPFKMLDELMSVEQSPIHHPEGNVWKHTLMVVDEATKQKKKSKNQAIFMWAALLHDIGKASTTEVKKGRITAYNHDKAGAELSKEFLSAFSTDKVFINKVSQLVRYHMQILFVVNELPFADIDGMKQNTDIEEIALLGLCDRLGRTGRDTKKEEENVKLFLQKCGR
ncbi:MAG: HDIG domain-containing protein [Oscillospiraceae bacterium]|nr:HDIG domain-containing protein [Oscillospiraceae bacterium]